MDTTTSAPYTATGHGTRSAKLSNARAMVISMIQAVATGAISPEFTSA